MEKTSDDDRICLQPELLDSKTIIQVLNERRLKIKDINSLRREELITIYKSYVLPLPQRDTSKPITTKEMKYDPKENDINHLKKKLKLNNCESLIDESRKRNNNGLSEGDVANIKRKRQKITWP